MMASASTIQINLPKYGKVKLLIFKYSSFLRLESGVKFRVCNVCSKRLPVNVSIEHSQHLKKHEKRWNHYLIMMSKLLQEQCESDLRVPPPHLLNKSDNEDDDTASSSSSGDIFNVLNGNAVDCLGYYGLRPPPLTTFEHILINKFTHDKNPVKEFREITDWKVAKGCNVLKFNSIVDELGDGIGASYLNPKQLYSSTSEVVRKISRLVCDKQCYYLPGECLFEDAHTSNFKDLMKKDVHDAMNPHFKTLLSKDSEGVPILQYNESHHPQTYELCEKIGFNTHLEYNEEGFLDLNYDLFCPQLWENETPLFILEENKVLDVLLALVLSASSKYSFLRAQIAQQYLQRKSGLNSPVCSTMMHGPDLHSFSNIAENCNTTRDEKKAAFKEIVTHKNCKSMINADHWMFIHHMDNDDQNSSLDINLSRQGPASLPDQTHAYPCNLGHWHGCECESCELLRLVKCKSHKKHLEFNLDSCPIKESVSCQEHKIDHPDNVQPGDIIIQKNIIFHNGELLKNGRNYQHGETVLAGLKLRCRCCRRNTKDHFENHHSIHPICELCVFEVKTLKDDFFWKKVCSICGKKFESEELMVVHKKKHDVPRETCEICEETFSSKFNFKRHMVEQHNVFLNANNGPYDGTDADELHMFTCNICQKEFRYERNVVTHVEKVHFGKDECECKICGVRFTRRYNLKTHLNEQHGVRDVGLGLKREKIKMYTCSTCKKQFQRRYHLAEHERQHQENKITYSCDLCEATFASKSKLTRHKTTRHISEPKLPCSVCDRKFHTLWSLNNHFKTHSESRQTFQCTVCTQQYLSRWSLARHIKIKH